MVTKKRVTTKTTTKIPSKIPGSPGHPLYGRPILDVIRTGNIAQMKKMAATARAHVKDVTSALNKLEAKIKTASK